MAENITYSNFIENYFRSTSPNFNWQTTPFQIYALESIANSLKIPTALLQADYHFLVYLSQGKFSQQVGIEQFELSNDSILFVPAGEIFSIKSVKGKLKGFFMLLEDKVLSSLIQKVELTDLLSLNSVNYLNRDDSQWIDTLCNLLLQEMNNARPNRKIGDGLLQSLFHKLISLNPGEKAITRQSEIAINFKQLLNKRIAENKSVDFYAQQLNISTNYLNRCVKVKFNKTCKQLIRETAIVQSQILMLDTNKDIIEIAMEMGFEDASYFSRLFKSLTGETPSSFRNKIKQGLS
ncbi:helix-turn-helix domain-containing protein [Mangrovimonas aestuarii]|uniref:helix-turn-helix domain-containing protein n=1 Tax=Mangrovimonas aestuarii TaxID=3018443 RepID=UPI0023792219|nr:AraC family transcriptional regulator [Mangrovimonas aestuarii]